MSAHLAMLPGLLQSAQDSADNLRRLNQLLAQAIPFNAPHGFVVESVAGGAIRTRAPYRPENFNHIQGIHACGIATIAELSSGLLLLARLNPAEYRLIMAKLEIDYHYQAKADLIAETTLSPERMETEILAPLRAGDSLTKTLQTTVRDVHDNLVATAQVSWQIKAWANVRTRME